LFGAVRFDKKDGWIVPPKTIHPERFTKQLAKNRVLPEEISAEQVLPFVPRGREVNQDDDNRLSLLATNLSDMLSTHAVSTAVMELQDWDFTALYYTAIDHFSHSFMSYHPPRLPWVSEQEFELYKDVINSVYRFSDMTLRRLIDLAGPDATVIVCSDHGFQSGAQRPRLLPNEPAAPAAWHRQFGIFVAKGPNIKKDERVQGATLLDIAPTILSMFGLPAGKDMDGRPLVEIFERPPMIQAIDSWDAVDGEAGMIKEDTATSSADDADQIMQQLAALGYVEAPGANKEEQAKLARIEGKYNIASNLIWCQKHREAADLLLELLHESPWEPRFIMSAVRAFINMNNLTMAEKLLKSAFDIRATRNPNAILAWADILRQKNDPERAHALVLLLESKMQNSPTAQTQFGLHYLWLRKHDDAERAFRRAVQLHPENAEAHQGLSTVFCRQGKNQETVDAALAALGFVYQMPQAHLNLGIALARSGNTERAIGALRTALHYNRDIRKAHRWLAIIYNQNPLTRAQAEFHRDELKRIAGQTAHISHSAGDESDELFPLPPIPSEQDRDRTVFEHRPAPDASGRRSGRVFTLVSGLPRSGTSLMMQMLEAAGLPPKTDGERTADVDNPKGYYEWEAIKQIAAKPSLLDEPDLEKKAIKVISMLLQAMPYRHDYRIIFMTRPIDEVMASQQAMIKNRETTGASLSPEQLKAGMASHREEVLRWLDGHPRAKHLEIDYPSLVNDPEPFLEQIASFLGPELLPHPEKMRAVIDGTLYRRRGK